MFQSVLSAGRNSNPRWFGFFSTFSVLLLFAEKALCCSPHFCFQGDGGKKKKEMRPSQHLASRSHRGNIWFSRERLQYQPAGEECTFSQGPSVYLYLNRNLYQSDPQGHRERLCGEEAVTQCELPSAREHEVKTEWASATFTSAGTACVGPGHHFVPSTSREVKPHLSYHGLQPMLHRHSAC